MPLEQSTAAEVVEPKKQIYGKIFTVEWLLNSLKKNDKIYQQLHSDKIVKDVTFYDVSGGKGFLSAILRCTVHFANTNDVYSTILKIPGLEAIKKASKTLEMNKKDSSEAKESGNKKYEAIEDSHKFECDFYNNLAPLLDIPCPKVYQTLDFKVGEKEGVIHMEDLTLRGKTITYFENINLTQIKCVIQHLAHMHYRVLKCIDQNEWRGKYLKKQEAMETITKNFDLMFKPLLKSSQREGNFKKII
uniref:Uncharacterized protein n=1 Tax=Panagrolaimus sp. ES5 TaxID=591445 RepID=A0AC34FWG5_9BILA